MTHIILGAGGSIGNALSYELLKSNEKIRLVSRSGYAIEGTDSFRADLTSWEETQNSLKGGGFVYLCAGLPYETKIWEAQWPVIMQNTIDACKSVGAKLIFFDNVYMYGRVDGIMTEETPYNPCSKKGEVRAKIATRLEEEIRQKNIQAIIARSADLYGPFVTKNSIPYLMVFEKYLSNAKAQWVVNSQMAHSFTYTIDCAKGLQMLANDEKAFNQIWHLPTQSPALDGKSFIETAAKEIGVKPSYSILHKWMIRTYGMINKTVAELNEMLYQYEYPYHFDSGKFNQYFDYKPITYLQGIHDTVEFLKKK